MKDGSQVRGEGANPDNKGLDFGGRFLYPETRATLEPK